MSKFLPLITRPHALAFKNRWRRNRAGKGVLFRDLSVVGLTGFLVVLSYSGTLWVLETITTSFSYIFLPASFLLGLILTFLLAMLLVSNSIAALGTLYFSKDLSFILSTPVSGPKFFFGKFLDTLVSSSWMTALLLFPVLIAFGVFYEASSLYYLWAALVLIPYFALPAAVAMSLATLLVISIPIRRRKEAVIFSFLTILFLLFSIGSTLLGDLGTKSKVEVGDILRIVSFLNDSNRAWTPAFWVSSLLGDILQKGSSLTASVSSVRYLTLLLSSLCMALSLAYLLMVFLYEKGYARANYTAQLARKRSAFRERVSQLTALVFGKQTKALVEKEYRAVTRDVTQAVQFILLLGICGLYIYSLTVQGLFTQFVPKGGEKWWQVFLLIVNSCVEAFVVTAMGSRFVYPSISREGKSFWVLRTAPIHLEQVLKIKFIMWTIVLGCISSTIFGTAIYLVTEQVGLAILKAISNWIMSIGIVGMAVGFGAYFSNFRYEHLGQIATSFGSLVYMLSAILLIALNIVLALVIYRLSGESFNFTSFALGVITLLFVNVGAASLMLAVGKRSVLREL